MRIEELEQEHERQNREVDPAVIRCHVHPVAGPRVAAPARLVAPEAKAAEAAEFDLLLAAARLGDAAEYGLDSDYGTLLREVGDVDHLLDVKRRLSSECLVVRHVIIFGYGHGLQRAIIDESQHRTPERLIMAQH